MKTLPLAEVKAHLSALVSEIEAQHEQVTVTKNGAPATVMISVHEWESLLETIAVLSDQQTVADLAEAQRTRDSGEAYSTDDVLAAFEARRSAGA
ncbi:type II toxin-antitoxin system Phd/YefM family antitoxin [Allokutzneria sp. NRRL B-24872]|uniref:type II toxin-antitoxin system Phd/YefM family antitoxin n=1 Tax=Allokutzneria sp. NRRL B-24872 TaxID=1137961 RepID=UPI00143DBEA2|nr:type II toxin-antitoxin system Phd/YefM family antitoxin [Allokutzneria sp. NRRL B-24872]